MKDIKISQLVAAIPFVLKVKDKVNGIVVDSELMSRGVCDVEGV